MTPSSQLSEPRSRAGRSAGRPGSLHLRPEARWDPKRGRCGRPVISRCTPDRLSQPPDRGFRRRGRSGQLSQPVPLGSFTPPPNVTTRLRSPASLSAEDIDGDGNTDLLLAVFGTPGGVAIWSGDGQAGSARPGHLPRRFGQRAIAGDFRSTSLPTSRPIEPTFNRCSSCSIRGRRRAPGRAFR